MNAARTPAERCPVCRRAPGRGNIKLRQVGRETKHGVPMIASVTTVQLTEGRLTQICGGCSRGLLAKRTLASFLMTGSALALAMIGIWLGSWGYVLALGAVGLVVPGAMYSWADRLIWGSALARRLGLPGVHFPAGLGQVAWRAFLFVVAGIVLLAWIDPS